jgi:ribose-phosphate pyrophosphokinase
MNETRFIFDISEDNGFSHKIFKFPAGEVSVKITSDFYCPEEDLTAVIIAKGADSDMIFKIMLMKEALERKGFNKFILELPYLPYARQDRVCNEGEAFSLKVFCNLINSMNFSEVVVLDAHSDVGPALLNNCTNVDPYKHILDSIYEICGISDTEKLNIVSPDAGANKKCNKIYSKLIHQFSDMPLNVIGDLVKCDKTRDVTTGQLSGFEVFADDLKGHDCLIVDDICDGGGTFLGLADELKKKNAGKLYLYVSHGIFSKGIDILLEKFDMIFTTSSYQTQPDHPKLKVIG